MVKHIQVGPNNFIERKTSHHHLISKNEIVYDVVLIFNNLCIPKKYFLV